MKARIRESVVGPFFGLVTFWFAMEYLRPQDYSAAIGGIRPGLIMLVVMGTVWLARGEKSALKDSLVRLYIAFIALGVVSVFFATNNYWAAQRNMDLISFMVGGVLPFIAFMDRPEALRRFFGWWVLIHALVAIGGIIRGGIGSGSFMGDENDLALTLAMALPFAWFLSTQDKRPMMKVLFIVAGLLMIAAIVATRSRGGFLGMMTAGFAIVYFSRHRVRNLLGITVVAGLAAFVLMQSQLTDPLEPQPGEYFRQRHAQSYMDEMSSIQDARDATRLSRFYYWGRSWEMFLDNPMFGVGTSNFGWRVEQYETRDPTFPGDRAMSGGRVSHSLYFTVLAEYGLAGTAVFAAIVTGLFLRLRHVRRRLEPNDSDDGRRLVALSRGGSASLLAFLVSGGFLTVLYYPHMWYLLGFAIAIDRSARSLVPEPARRPVFSRAGSPPAPSKV